MTTKEILKSHQTLHAVSAIPELVAHILEYIPSSDFGSHLLEVSPIWRAEAGRVLWKRYEKAEEVYKQAVEHYNEVEEAFWQDCTDGSKPTDVFAKAYREKSTRFEEIIAIFRVMLRCGFVTKESNKVEYLWIRVNTQMFKDGIIPGEFDEKVDQAIRIVRKRVYSDKF
jgi:hypothetical protein